MYEYNIKKANECICLFMIGFVFFCERLNLNQSSALRIWNFVGVLICMIKGCHTINLKFWKVFVGDLNHRIDF